VRPSGIVLECNILPVITEGPNANPDCRFRLSASWTVEEVNTNTTRGGAADILSATGLREPRLENIFELEENFVFLPGS
jgi:hypothetical protein